MLLCEVRNLGYDVSYVLNHGSAVAANPNGKIFLVPSSMKSEDIATILSEGYDVELLQQGFYEVGDTLELIISLWIPTQV